MRDIIKTAVTLTLICLIVTAALAVTDYVTKDIIVNRTASDAKLIRSQILPAADYQPDASAAALIAANPSFRNIKETYKAIADDGSLLGYVITASSTGYSGEIDVVTGIDPKGMIVGVNIAQIAETPGLGMKALDKPFLSQLSGFVPSSALNVIKSAKTRPEEIEAISGATITSKAVTLAVQSAVDFAKLLMKNPGGVPK
jgi:electron transport complex protein RnfG